LRKKEEIHDLIVENREVSVEKTECGIFISRLRRISASVRPRWQINGPRSMVCTSTASERDR